MEGRRKTETFLRSLDEDLIVYEEELKKRGFTSSATLKYLREHDLEEMGMAEGHKRLLMNAVSKLQSPQQTKENNSTSAKKRRINFGITEPQVFEPNTTSNVDSGDERNLSSSDEEEQPQYPSTSDVETPVQRFLRHKRDEITKLQKQLAEKNADLNLFNSGIHEAVGQNNEQSYTACGQCHLRIGHTRRNCTLSPCKSVYSCGLIDKHPDQKRHKKALESEKSQLQRKIAKLQAEHDSYVKAKTSIDQSKTKVIEDRLLGECPSRYVNANGTKNWMQLNKDVAILERQLTVKDVGLPDRRSMMTLLKNTMEESLLNGSLTKKNNENPKRPALEAHGIKFPKENFACSSTSTLTSKSSSKPSPFEVNTEISDFALAVSLQNKECNEYKDKQEQYEAASCLMDMFNSPRGSDS